jgi:small neutral amino acid transporter SnatA (MarC family)
VIAAVITFLVAVNPAAASVALARDWRTDRPVPVAAGTAFAGLLLVALAGLAEPILDALDLSLGTFRLGAGVVVTVSGLRALLGAVSRDAAEPTTDGRLTGYVFFPTLVTPAAAVVAVSVGGEEGVGRAAVGALLAVFVGGLGVFHRRRIPELLAGGLVRLLGAGAVVVGIGLAFEGIRTL